MYITYSTCQSCRLVRLWYVKKTLCGERSCQHRRFDVNQTIEHQDPKYFVCREDLRSKLKDSVAMICDGGDGR